MTTRRVYILVMLISFLMTFVSAFNRSISARAYNDYGLVCGWSYSGGSNLLYLPYRDDPDYPPYGAYDTALDSAIVTWTGTATPVYFYATSGGTHSIGARNGGDNGYAGWVTIYCAGSGGHRSSSALILNSYYLDSYSQFGKIGAASHELGHYLGLGHSYYTAIMGYNDGSFNSPRTDDVCGVNTMYPSTSWPPTCGY